jgi:hypothetical protein
MTLDPRRRLRELPGWSGCGRRGTGCGRRATRAPGAAANEYFPLVAGAHWRYKLALEIGSGEVEVVARGDSAVEGLPGVVFIMDEHALGADALGIVEVGPTAYVARDGFLCRYTGLDYRSPTQLACWAERPWIA